MLHTGLRLLVDAERGGPIHVVASYDTRKDAVFPESVSTFRNRVLFHILYVVHLRSPSFALMNIPGPDYLHSLHAQLANRVHCELFIL